MGVSAVPSGVLPRLIGHPLPPLRLLACGEGLALAPNAGLFVMLALFEFGEEPGLLALLLEALQRAFERFIGLDDYLGHSAPPSGESQDWWINVNYIPRVHTPGNRTARASARLRRAYTVTTLVVAPLWAVGPFVLMLLAIAICPLTVPHWWERNRNKLVVSAVLGAPVLILYLVRRPSALLGTAEEYVSFIVMLGGLYVISGGILLRGDLEATPITNTAFLALGAVIASFIGTTGASMLLIRALLQTNRERQYVRHTVIFFIFLVFVVFIFFVFVVFLQFSLRLWFRYYYRRRNRGSSRHRAGRGRLRRV